MITSFRIYEGITDDFLVRIKNLLTYIYGESVMMYSKLFDPHKTHIGNVYSFTTKIRVYLRLYDFADDYGLEFKNDLFELVKDYLGNIDYVRSYSGTEGFKINELSVVELNSLLHKLEDNKDKIKLSLQTNKYNL